MSIKVGQAVYGEKERGHALLAASPMASQIAAAILYHMDVQGTVPPGIVWRPFYSGFAHGDWYVVARTAPDPAAPRGMVRSHALFLPIGQAVQLDHLGPALTQLGADPGLVLDDANLEEDGDDGCPSQSLAAALLDQGTYPIVWPSEDGFTEALIGLWRHLWPAARANLSFRLAFSPQDVAGRAPTIVTIPAVLAPRWMGYRLVESAPPPSDQAIALLTGHRDAAALRGLIATIGAGLGAIPDLRMALEISEALAGAGDFPDSLGALRLLNHLSPAQETGQAEKISLIALCAEKLARATLPEMRMTRNLDLAAVAEPQPLWSAVRDWTAARLFAAKDRVLVAETLHEALGETSAVPAWRAAVREGFDRYARSELAANSAALWQVFVARPALLEVVLRAKLGGGGLSDRLAGTVPDKKVAATVAEAWLGSARVLGLVDLHAACAAALLPPKEAVDCHMRDMDYTDRSLARAVAHASGAELVVIALAHDVRLLLDAAAAACTEAPKLLAAIDIADGRARSLWAETLAREPLAWNGPRHARRDFNRLLETMLDTGLRDAMLLAALAKTPLANLLDHRRRAELWEMLPASVVGSYLAATADAWTDAFLAGPEETSPEPRLAAILAQQDRYRPLLERLRGDPEAGCRLFRTFPTLSEREFERWLDEVVRHSSAVASAGAEALGRLIAARTWSDAAKQLADHILAGRDDLRPSLAYCGELIGLFRQYRLDILWGTTSDHVRWRTLEDVVIDLYGYGPQDHQLWDRAGGKQGDIPKTTTGAEAWRKVIADAERGKRAVDIGRLIETMYQDYPRHPILQKMRYDRFHERRH